MFLLDFLSLSRSCFCCCFARVKINNQSYYDQFLLFHSLFFSFSRQTNKQSYNTMKRRMNLEIYTRNEYKREEKNKRKIEIEIEMKKKERN